MTSTFDTAPYALVAVDDQGTSFIAARLGLGQRLLARLRAGALDRRLASGASPETSLQLAARARAIVTPSARRKLARNWAHLLAAAELRPSRLRSSIIIRPAAVLGAAPAIRELIDVLRQPMPVPAQGVAMASVLLIDGTGPIYDRRSEQSLTARLGPIVDLLLPGATLDPSAATEQ